MTSSNRRRFIGQSAALASGFSGLGTLRGACAQDRGPLDPHKLQQLRSKLKGTLILPDETGYEDARRVFYWNPHTQRTPQAVVRCVHEEDVVRAVEFAQEYQLEVAVRSGGHSHLAWGSSDGLVIDLSPMKAIKIDPDRRIVRAEGGALGGEIARAAGEYGLVPVLGQCPGVGATGVILGGGLGWLSGLYGACCDNLLSARIVTAAGKTLDVSPETDADLFWGLQGAGANFGVATSFEARLRKIGTVLGGDVHFRVQDARTVLHGFHELMRAAPDEFQATLNLTRSERGLFLNFCHAGEEKAADVMLQSIRSIAKPMRENIARQDYALFAQRAPATNPGTAPASIFRAVQTVYRERLTDEIIDNIVDQLGRATPDVVMGLSHYMHGEVCRVAPEATAFPHRLANSVHLRAAYNWSDPSESQQRFAWGDQWLSRFRPAANERIYANYQTYSTDMGARALFDVNHDRLQTLKRKYDPENFFRRNANIG